MTFHVAWDWAADCSRLVVLRRQRSCLQNCCASDWQRVFECRQNAVHLSVCLSVCLSHKPLRGSPATTGSHQRCHKCFLPVRNYPHDTHACGGRLPVVSYFLFIILQIRAVFVLLNCTVQNFSSLHTALHTWKVLARPSKHISAVLIVSRQKSDWRTIFRWQCVGKVYNQAQDVCETVELTTAWAGRLYTPRELHTSRLCQHRTAKCPDIEQ